MTREPQIEHPSAANAKSANETFRLLFLDSEDNIIPEAGGRFRVKAQTEIEDFNAQFGTAFEDEEFDTVGGLVLKAFGRLPKRGEVTTLGEFRFRVLRADSRRLHTLHVERIAPPPGDDDGSAKL